MRILRVGAFLGLAGWAASGTVVRALPTTSVVVENLVGGGTPAGGGLLDADGLAPLTAGTAADGDGALVVLGYFAGSAAGPTFSGAWTPLVGPGSANTGISPVTIGDRGSLAAGPYGYFTAKVDFDAADPATFANTPPAGTRLAVAVYNGPTVAASTQVTIATNDAWRWVEPAFFPVPVQVNLNDPGTIWFGGAAGVRRTSEPVAVFPGSAGGARLVNISSRGFVGAGDAILIPGFFVAGGGTKAVLVRGVGPTLGEEPFSLPGVLADPVLDLVRQDSAAAVAGNDDWFAQADAAAVEAAMAGVGAFALPPSSRDAAVRVDLAAGVGYTARVGGSGGGTGVAIAEVYVIGDEGSPDARLSNLSTRGFVGTGNDILIAGFVLGAGGPRRLLIRGVGPTLAGPPFGLGGVLADPVIRVFPIGGGPAVAENDDWEADGDGPRLALAAADVGAFALAPGSGDAALVLTAAGDAGYTVQVSGAGGATGLAIVEIYALP